MLPFLISTALSGLLACAGLQLVNGLRRPGSRRATVKVALSAGAICVLFPALVLTALMRA